MQRNILYGELKSNSNSYRSSNILFIRRILKQQNEINVKFKTLFFAIFKILVRVFKRTGIFVSNSTYYIDI